MSAARIGILYSTRGPYGAIGRDCRDGAEFAMEELTAAGVAVEPVFADPAGEPARYIELARAMLREQGCRHIIGTITSAARKDLLPLVEKHDGLLWYMCPYEGFEANESVIYTGACPNQHLLPLFEHLVPRHGGRAYLAGANYVWGWEMNRLARELLLAAGGEVLGERCLPLEETDVARLVADIERRRPDFILNNLIGPASYAFFAAMQALAARDAAFRPEACPIVSCDLTECELGEIGPGVATGHLATACYFGSLATPENLAFKAAVARRWGGQRQISSFFAGAYTAVRLCVEAIVQLGDDDPVAVRGAITRAPHATVQGLLRIDARTNHAALPFHLGRINDDGGFDIIASRPAIAADPYLSGSRPARAAPHLRVVS
ncbi:transporter substrate-binding domain-containing protein [Labrys wisconsinensis]|uniref:Branched-chain amino acid transport system substrate-binding protein n=1 Tax=Labrys wisconsinensis TaxID=425677 RepID=A0ABU0J7Q3_9HYPH|nr:transporter substrate-binding domain-containing protein [Labrys wisconsinensis]MDQ0470301.1 branched-chain amino acid transport system substrate-binding protein [Labrys wisconsinensis]